MKKLTFAQWKWIVLGIGLVVRLALPWVLRGDMYKGDGAEYRFYAWNLEHHGVYSGEMGDPPRPGYDRMPGVPLLIYGMSRFVPLESRLMLLPNLLAGFLIFYLLFLFIEKLKLDSKLTRWMLLLYACIPVVDYYSAQFYPEVPAALFLLLSFWWLFRAMETQEWFYSFLSGAAVALGSYFRPELVMTLVVLGPALIFSGGQLSIRIKNTALMGWGFFLLLSPWIARNYVNEKKFIPLGDNFLIEKQDSLADDQRGCSRGLYMWLNTWHYRERHVKTVAWDFMHTDLSSLPEQAFRSEAEKQTIAALQQRVQYDCGCDRTLMRIARERMSEAPLKHYLLLPLQRMFFLLFRTERFDSLDTGHLPAWMFTLLFLVFALFSNAMSLSAFAGVLWLRRLPVALRWMLAAAWMRWMFFAWFYHVEVRYMLLYFPVFFLVGLQLFHNPQKESPESPANPV